MKRYIVDAAAPSADILADCSEAIRAGRVLLCPTDTCYILAANALDPNAIESVFAIKGRSYNNPIHIIVSSIEEAERFGYLNQAARLLAGRFLPGRLTLVVGRRPGVPDALVSQLPTVGIRIPDNTLILQLAAAAGVPVTATSANHSGSPTPYTVDEALDDLGGDAEMIYATLDQGPLARVPTSTLIDVTEAPPKILREGAIPGTQLLSFLESTGTLS